MKDSERQELYKLIGRNIGRYLKGFKSMSQANFVEEIGMGNRATLSNIIAGRQQVSIHLLFDIAKGLNLNPSDLLPSIEEIEQKERTTTSGLVLSAATLESELKRGASEEDAERIAAATTNKTRREKGETES